MERRSSELDPFWSAFRFRIFYDKDKIVYFIESILNYENNLHTESAFNMKFCLGKQKVKTWYTVECLLFQLICDML